MIRNRLQARRRLTGLTLIELMVAMLIGFFVIGACLVAFLGSGASSRHSQALAQMSDDASNALAVLRQHLQLAGYVVPTHVDADGRYTTHDARPVIYGCDGGFVDARAGFDALACRPGIGDAVALRYVATAQNSLLSSDSVPLDCLGNAFDDATPGLEGRHAEARFYLAVPSGGGARSLYCKGAAAAPQPLVENVHDLQLRYGVADAAEPERVGSYRTASQMNDDDWSRVVSVRICVVMRSAENVQDAPTEYRDCAMRPAMASDRRLYRSFVSTVALQNLQVPAP